MQSSLTTSGVPAVQVPVMVAAELQDSLLVVMHDLQRLEGLLSHATDNLLERFGEANGLLTDSVVGTSPELAAARVALRSAVSMTTSGHGRGCGSGRLTVGRNSLGSASLRPDALSHRK